jgi:ubiquinone/menaquinone biosynthesis C-methylase UbiE
MRSYGIDGQASQKKNERVDVACVTGDFAIQVSSIVRN